MSLRIWLPMTKDLRNQGLADVIVAGGVINNNGKLGNCYTVNKNNALVITHSLPTTSEFTFSFWIKIPAAMANGDSWEQIMVFSAINIAGGSASNTGISWANYDNVKIYDDSKHQWLWAAPNREFEYDTWHHWTITHTANGEGVQCKIYIDGNLINVYNNITDPLKLIGGCIVFGGGISSSSLYFNDIRIYDHCLSPMEVKQISQGLVLHYPLDRGGWGQENLASQYIMPGGNAPGNTTTSGRTNYYGDYGITIPATENADTYFSIWYSEPLESGAVYTLSAEVSGLVGNSYYNFPLFAQNNTSMGLIKFNHNGLNTLTFTMNYTGTISTATINGKTYYRMFMDDITRTIASGQGAITIKNIKLEKGSIATPWCPNSSDELATIMGMNDGIEYDCSGFGNNGTRTGSFTWTSNTPKYQVSTSAQGSSGAKIVGPGMSAEAKSAAIWVKCAKTVNSVFFADKNSTLECGLLNSLIYAKTTNSAGFTTTHWKDNQWNHVVVVNDNGTRKVYVNGESETASGANNNYMHTTDAVYLWTRSDNNNYPFNGQMSDFRVYATALSASDVLSLYQNSAYIDSSGNVYGAVHTEV